MDALFDEVESLEAILMEDVEIRRSPESGIPEMIETTVFPEVGGDTDRQYICVTLQVLPKPGYPDVSPEFNLQRPRGLDDCRLNEIKNACVRKLNESVGYPVVFDLIDVIREHLTGSNLPSGQCVVCLYGFREGDEFTKTECYHYLHSYCLARHLIASKRNYQEEQDKLPTWLRKMSDPFQAVCPVCREPIKDEVEHLSEAPPPADLENAPDFQLTEGLKELQVRMTNLFLHQKSRGAIIDLEAEESNVISIEPEDQTSGSRRKAMENASAGSGTIQENGTQQETNVGGIQNAHSNSRHHLQSRANHTRGPPARASNQANCTTPAPETTSNNYSASHHSRRHHHYRGGRRHHNHHHHHHYQNSSHSQQDPAKQQKTANVQAPCGSSTR